MSEESFKQRVYAIVVQIPRGRVMTYGQIAALSGSPRAARQVGQIAHFGPVNLPWQRVVNKKGGLAIAWPEGGRMGHKLALESDGIVVNDDLTVNVQQLLWWPE